MKKLILLLTIVPLVLASAVRAEEQINYVIKVTPTLAYLDVGEAVGAMEGATYIIMREDDDDWVVVGEVQLVRVDEHFSIGEIVDMIDSESIEVLQRAVPLSEWAGRQGCQSGYAVEQRSSLVSSDRGSG